MRGRWSVTMVALCVAGVLPFFSSAAQASTWQALPGGNIHYHAADLVDDSYGWVGGITFIPEGMAGFEDSATIGRTGSAGQEWQYSTSHEISDDTSLGWNFLTVTTLDFVDRLHGWATLSDGTILATVTGGQRWSAQAEGSFEYRDNNWGYASLSMSGLTHGVAVGGWVGFIGVTYPRIVYTTNGTDWTEAVFDKPAQSSLEAVCMVDAQYGWAAGTAVQADGVPLVLVTHDGGATWSRQTRGLPSNGTDLHGVWFVDRQRGWVVGDGGAIYVTADGGATWWKQPSGTTETLLDVRFADPVAGSAGSAALAGTVGWAVGEKGTILETTRGGLPWSPQNSGVQTTLRALATAGSTVWAAGDAGVILTATVPTAGTSGTGFSDIASSPYKAAIESLAAAGIAAGFTDGSFRPETTIKRAQFVKLIVGALEIGTGEAVAGPFTDLGLPDAAGYPHIYVRAAFEHAITNGANAAGTLFAPWEPIRRAQAVSMVVRGAKNLMPEVLIGPPPGTPSHFAGIGEPHGENLRLAEYNGLLAGLLDPASGTGQGAGWDPTTYATRGEVAQMLYNLRR